MADAILAFADVVVAFGALRAVDGVTLSVPRGERRAIIGPNGAGKTTLFNAATGIIRPAAGRIMFDGADITRLPPYRRARLGKAIRRLESQESAPDHDDRSLAGGKRQQQIDIAAIAECMHAGKIGAGNVEPQR